MRRTMHVSSLRLSTYSEELARSCAKSCGNCHIYALQNCTLATTPARVSRAAGGTDDECSSGDRYILRTRVAATLSAGTFISPPRRAARSTGSRPPPGDPGDERE